MRQIRFTILKVGITFHARQFWKYKCFWIVPGVTVGVNSDFHNRIEIELNFLCFAIGVSLFKKK